MKPTQFKIPLNLFDVSLLPEDARDIGSESFQEAVVRYFVDKYSIGSQGAIVSIDSEHIVVFTFPNSVKDPFDLALKMLQAGEIKEALPFLLTISRSRPHDATVLYNLGLCYSETGEYDQAVMTLQSCIQIDPKHANALVGLGVAYERIGQLAQAEKYLRAALAIEPSNTFAIRNLGAVLGSQNKTEDALALLKKATELAPKDSLAWHGYGVALLKLGQVQEADLVFEKIILEFPADQVAEYAREARTKLANKVSSAGKVGGLRPDVMMYIADTLKIFKAKGLTESRNITLEVALLGRNGLDINDPTKKYSLRSLPGKYSGLHLLSIMYAGFQQVDPTADLGVDYSKEYAAAQQMMSK